MVKIGLILTLLSFSPSLLADQPDSELSGKQGYLVLDLDLGRRVSEIVFAKRRSARNNRITSKRMFGPFEKGRHLLFLPLDKGSYQLMTVSSPHYDLPYKQNYGRKKRLSFQIKPGRTNYFGKIIVGEERLTYGFYINVVNRLAGTLHELQEQYTEELDLYPIHYAGVLEDLFYREFLQIGGAKK